MFDGSDEMSEFGSKSPTNEEKHPMAGKITALDLAPAELSAWRGGAPLPATRPSAR
jgi:hypothetical protein